MRKIKEGERDQPGHTEEGEAGIQLTPLETWAIPRTESLPHLCSVVCND